MQDVVIPKGRRTPPGAEIYDLRITFYDLGIYFLKKGTGRNRKKMNESMGSTAYCRHNSLKTGDLNNIIHAYLQVRASISVMQLQWN